MIDFRYHLVSIVAIILALTLGLVLGTTTLNGPVLDNLNGQVAGLRTDKQDLRTQLGQAQHQLASDSTFVKLALPMLVGGRLDGQRVAVLSAPGTPDALRRDVVAAVSKAGATLTLQLRINRDYVDPAKDATLASLVAGLRPGGTAVPSGDGAKRAAAELAAVIVTKPGGDAAELGQDAAEVLRTFQQAGMITLEGGTPGSATLAVLLSGPAEKSPSATSVKGADNLLALAAALDARSGGTVIGGPLSAATNSGLVAAARSSDAVKRDVGTVDSADLPIGQVETVLALVAQLRGDTVAWGAGPGTSAPTFPSS